MAKSTGSEIQTQKAARPLAHSLTAGLKAERQPLEAAGAERRARRGVAEAPQHAVAQRVARRLEPGRERRAGRHVQCLQQLLDGSLRLWRDYCDR